MCGIATIFSYLNGPPVLESELLAIRDRMASVGTAGGHAVADCQELGLEDGRAVKIGEDGGDAAHLFFAGDWMMDATSRKCCEATFEGQIRNLACERPP